jgi:protein required for attachment to host cells
MNKTWILITDAHRARCFERDAQNHVLVELSDFIYPGTHIANAADRDDVSSATGKGHGRTGHAGTRFEPHTEIQDQAQHSFAKQLAHYLNQAAGEHRFHELVLIATPPMLGALRPALSPAAEKMLKRSVASDLTHYTGPALQERVDHALQATV